MTEDGPAWTAPGLNLGAGKYPLAVEQHVIAMAGRLIPGVTTVTPHARYFTVHALVAAEAARRNLDRRATQDLMRRAEVALATVSYAHHGGGLTRMGRPHGSDALAERLRSGVVRLAEASIAGKGGYVQAAWGFSGAYFGSEVVLGLLDAGRTPGPACDEAALRTALGELIDLAEHDELLVVEMHDRSPLCFCAGGNAPDGQLLARLLCGADRRAPDEHVTEARRNTIQLVARVIDTHHIESVTHDVGDVMAFGDFLPDDEITATNPVAEVWRGLVLRNHTASAWRRLWAWLVDQAAGLTHIDDLADALIERLPAGTVGSFLADLPDTMIATGRPAPAERQLWDGYDAPDRDLAILAIGARRTRELEGDALEVFAGRRDQQLSPAWFTELLDDCRAMTVASFANRLTSILVARSERVALAKTRRRADGTLWLPARLRVLEGGWVYRVGEEGRGDVNLRLDRLGNVLAGAGVLALPDQRLGRVQVTDVGRELLA